MSRRLSYGFALVLAALLVSVSVAPAGAAPRRGRNSQAPAASPSPVTSWTRLGLRHVTPQYILEALRQGQDWRAMLDARRHSRTGGGLLIGVAAVVPAGRDNALLVRGTRDGVQQLRELVGLLDTPAPRVDVLGLESSVTRAYQMALLGEWRKSVLAAESARSRSPENAEASALQAYSLVKSGRPNEAETLLTRALRQTEGATGRARALALVAAGALAESRGGKAQAVASYQNAGNADLSCALPYLAFADYVHRNGKNEVAKKMLQGGLSQVKTPEERAAIRARLGTY